MDSGVNVVNDYADKRLSRISPQKRNIYANSLLHVHMRPQLEFFDLRNGFANLVTLFLAFLAFVCHVPMIVDLLHQDVYIYKMFTRTREYTSVISLVQ